MTDHSHERLSWDLCHKTSLARDHPHKTDAQPRPPTWQEPSPYERGTETICLSNMLTKQTYPHDKSPVHRRERQRPFAWATCSRNRPTLTTRAQSIGERQRPFAWATCSRNRPTLMTRAQSIREKETETICLSNMLTKQTYPHDKSPVHTRERDRDHLPEQHAHETDLPSWDHSYCKARLW